MALPSICKMVIHRSLVPRQYSTGFFDPSIPASPASTRVGRAFHLFARKSGSTLNLLNQGAKVLGRGVDQPSVRVFLNQGDVVVTDGDVGRVDETRVTVGLLEDRKLLRQRLEQVLNIATKTERIMAVYVATADAVERFHDINQLTTDNHLYIFTTSMLRRHDRFFNKYIDTIKSPALSISVSHGSGGIPGSEVQLAEAKALEDAKARQEEAKARQEEAKATQEQAKTRRQTEKYTAMREFLNRPHPGVSEEEHLRMAVTLFKD
ncbi:hypothetical protein BDK51DRAFT_32216 [Blyttiomyces helicus]|uniref:Uncharacterized protein n=1 Tax=Blyttiomyces helicus TaxID=388810 RepID=A0A4P9W6D0_9FUNG|nr:hypothetical protein BDK51DRAFT_32216 [Blyttiomyces helicus]|eukprot:RKO85676.1 hypothetical protein BDK51DRAFT_32216 [Blyttiomyces helicus]